jgi:hypothetical protein
MYEGERELEREGLKCPKLMNHENVKLKKDWTTP